LEELLCTLRPENVGGAHPGAPDQGSRLSSVAEVAGYTERLARRLRRGNWAAILAAGKVAQRAAKRAIQESGADVLLLEVPHPGPGNRELNDKRKRRLAGVTVRRAMGIARRIAEAEGGEHEQAVRAE